MRSVDAGTIAQGYLSSSTSASFADRIRKAVLAKHDSPSPAELSDAWAATSLDDLDPVRSATPTLAYGDSYTLPPRRVADMLMSNYWQTAYPIFPLPDRLSFEASYEAIWTGAALHADPAMFHCLLNMIFALSAQTAGGDPLHQQSESAHTYFNRARSLLQFDLFSGWSLQLLQALLVSAQFLQSTDEPHQCWLAVGVAIMVATSLGLHLNSTGARMRVASERQLLRRLWYCCLIFDW